VQVQEFYGFETLKNNDMDLKEQILEILENNSEWLIDNDVILKSDYSKVADEIVKLLNLRSVTNRALLLKIERLEADNKLLNFMVENGLSEEDMINDITYPHEL
jgi:DNA polymerase III delta prime subunit